MPERAFHAPGRVNLIGEHTDHTDGLVLPAAIDLGITLEVEPGGDLIELESADASDTVRLAADGSTAPDAGWGRFVWAVSAELAAIGRAPVGMRGRLNSDLPRGAGLSSSAALEVVIGMALAAVAEMELEPLALAALARRAEHRAVGVPSGIMDQAASVLGRAGSAILLDCGTLEHHLVPLPSDYALLVIDSGVRRKLALSAYAERTRELGRALPLLRDRRPADVDPSELDVLLRDLDPVPARRLRHVITENARVRLAERALLAGDLVAVGDIFAAGHASLRDDFEVTVPELDSLVWLAREAGAVAARMTGGGFGGSVVALVALTRVEDVAAEVLRRYAGADPGRAGRAYVCRAADGAHELAR